MTTRKKLNRFNPLPDEMLLEIGNAVAQVLPKPRKDGPQLLIPPETRAFRSLSFVDKRFNYIFTPFLYRKLILRTSKARTSFLQHVAPNRTLCGHVQSVWHEADLYDPDYEDFSQLSLILQAVPLITSLKLGPTDHRLGYYLARKIATKNGTMDIPQQSMPNLRTLEIHLLNQDAPWCPALEGVAPQIEKLVVNGRFPGITVGCHRFNEAWYLHKNLKCLHIRGIETSWLDCLWRAQLEEIDLDLSSYLSHDPEKFNYEDFNRFRKPGRSLKSTRYAVREKDMSMKKIFKAAPQCYLWVGMFDRWRSSLKVLRVRAADVINDPVFEYLKQALNWCESGEISDSQNKIVKKKS
jgi:hypothetical protein